MARCISKPAANHAAFHKEKLTMNKFHVMLALFASAVPLFAAADDLPDPSKTPGALNPEVTQANLRQTVCVKGWTKTVRPPQYYTNKLKKIQIREYGYADANPRNYEEDHLVPLSVGGHPTDPHNLWPEPRKTEWSAARKDQLEFALYKAVCAGDLQLAEAQNAFRVNWIEAYRKYGRFLHRYSHGHAD